MARRSRESIEKEIKQLSSHADYLKRQEAGFQLLLDQTSRMHQEVTTEWMEVQNLLLELEAQKEPINWLPVELLALVFLAFVRLDFEHTSYVPPVIISHVSAKWRSIALSTPELWSHLVLRGFKPEITTAFLSRSCHAGLSIDYQGLCEPWPSEESRHVVDFLANTSRHFGRLEELSFRTNVALPIVYLLPSIDNFATALPRLKSLTLSIGQLEPRFLEARCLLTREEDILQTKNASKDDSQPSKLLFLSLEQIPLFNFPLAFIVNLRKLELSYSPRTRSTAWSQYFLKLTSLCRFLSCTPGLEELILKNTVPYYDAIPSLPKGMTLPEITSPPNLTRMQPTFLRKLKSLEWTYPYASDVARFLCMLEVPQLERIDIWLEDAPLRPIEMTFTRGYDPLTSACFSIHNTLSFPSLRDMSLQCSRDESTICFLRKFSFATIEKLAFTNVDILSRKSGIGFDLPIFPRLESVFRDPRLHHLTHFTLSHFEISEEPGKSESLIGYMPNLLSLSFDSCVGVRRILESLRTTLPKVGPSSSEPHPKLRVKYCPKLEAISLWKCHDLNFTPLHTLVSVRNQRDGSIHTSSAALPFSGTALEETAIDDPPNVPYRGAAADKQSVPERHIKPLRRTKTLTNTLSESEPVDLRYLRVTECSLIDKQALFSLQVLGVVDIIWDDAEMSG
ncbi:hypothetical protein CPB83DRAFT_857236 [Crepidotus variabilis]|uniref:F-box domain-containing protein n=1 Tax=Crepidotus variabilis TaxID=179855 RepID=A0A9P6JNM9_9AGAR|nr:hypothetical protein CPB83DRAFT_857236 [Crepidotus variabilis]